ncbi:MAG TPA: hypothetical protein VFT50_00630 [Baekduia sp.]|nr:hypothetical protein [Baekduia sp.]
MVNSEIRILHDADGTPVANVSFDLSAEQLAATARVTEAVRLERHQNLELSTDEVLAMRELTGVADELHRLAEHGAHGTVVLQLARFTALHDALSEWVHAADERGWMRDEDAAAYPLIEALLGPMADLRAEALHAVLGDSDRAGRQDAEHRF